MAILEGWQDDTDPRSWASLFGQLSGLAGPDKWRRIIGLCEPSITVGLDGAVDISATLPGREAFTFAIASEGAVIPTRKPNQFYKRNRIEEKRNSSRSAAGGERARRHPRARQRLTSPTNSLRDTPSPQKRSQVRNAS